MPSRLKHLISLLKILICLTGMLCMSGKAAAGVPVIDAAALAQAVEQVKAWGEQYKQMQDQIGRMQQQYNDLRSNPFGTILGQVGGTLGMDQAVGAAGQGGTEAGSGEATQKYLYKNSPCQTTAQMNNGATAKGCEAVRNLQATMMYDLQKQLLMVQKHEAAVESLLAAGSTVSPGEMQVLQIRLAAYNGILQADLAKIHLSIEMYKQRMALYKQQQIDSVQDIARGNGKAVDLKAALGM
ncbi:type IV secretion system protein [Leeia oryzae]|uniref:type IV secretion system protein n=1 Tax=Leeia oryzae TaxID=356662 RepID=UPI0003A63C08|nr:type IV secretion system protein [Leeia oryzae]